MLTFPVNAPSNILQCLVDLVKNEAHYLCCLENHVENFERKKKILAAKQQDVKINIENASGVSRVKNEAQQWIHEADSLIEVDTETKKKWFFGLCPSCYRQYHSGKELAKKTLEIDELLGRCSFNIVGGKTSMAIEVGVKLEESKYHSVILLDVSNPPDFKKIRGEIARHLNLTLEEGKEKEHSKTIWSRITNKKEKLLIILDDVWEEFDLIKDIGIPSSHQHKGCSVLIISRNLNVCEVMGCQRMIQLDMLVDKEAFNLFLIHANTSSSRLKGIAQNIVKQCGGLPIAIVAVARALRNRPLAIWREALKTLQNSKSMIDVNQNLTKIYKCLKLSYDNLKNEKAKKLFLICSIFPKDFEISIELLSKIGIGVGLFGEVEKYCTTRGKVLAAIQELVDSCLLLNLQDGLVKMHDLVREVALWIADKDIQVIMDFKTTIEANL
ncbi:disease resistance protein At4g27190-like [Prosopis cineraria]|uniref:disease resistance protein At4g27190-like n=1 Tax=Prosopis cineraria TaxID=364024 RepID=UPI0024106877|nr:disease resistance protein At4g27190-like [Prosopis cineraria]